MGKLRIIAFVTAAGLVSQTWSAQLDFDGLPLNVPAPDITVDGVTVSFEGLIAIAEHSSDHGFGGEAGDNTVFPTDPAHFGGRFLVHEGFAKAEHCPTNFLRTIRFDPAVADVSMHIADIDAGTGVEIDALDITNGVLRSLVFPASTDSDSKATFIDFGGISGISTIRISGDDPIGIDNLSFAPLANKT